MEKAFALREEVFVDEQKVPLEYEVDDRDSLEDTIHVGVFGVWNHKEASKLTYFGLHSLQHRGQEGAGIISSDGETLYSFVLCYCFT